MRIRLKFQPFCRNSDRLADMGQRRTPTTSLLHFRGAPGEGGKRGAAGQAPDLRAVSRPNFFTIGPIWMRQNSFERSCRGVAEKLCSGVLRHFGHSLEGLKCSDSGRGRKERCLAKDQSVAGHRNKVFLLFPDEIFRMNFVASKSDQ
jgi:hypothetical protein